jgi:tetratricopeptide (TPR) repeat protein
LAPVTVGVGDAKRLGYIDKSGRFLIQPRFLEGFDFSEGLAPVCFDREIESRAKSNVFDSKEPTESEYITGITTAIRDSVHKVAPSTVVRCVVGIDARGRLDSVRLKSGPDGLALDKRVLDCIVNTKLPDKPDYLSNWQKRDFPILIRNGSVTEEGSASDPAKAKFVRCEEIRAEIEKTHRLDDLIVREKLLQELVGIRHQLFNLADYELSTSLSELLNVAARLKHWSIAENAIKTLSQLELTGDLSFTTPHTGRQPLKAQSSQLSLAGLRLMQGRKDEALTLLLKASNNGDTTIKCAIYDQIGDIYFAKKDFKHAEQYYIQTCNTPEINSKNLPSLSTADPKIINSVNEQHKEKALYKLGMFYVAIDNLVKAKPCMDSFLRQLNTQDGKTTLATPNGFDWFEAYIALLNKERHFGEAEEFSKARALICAYDRTYIDRTGKQVGHMFFSSAEQFKDGLARVERFDRTGYINTAGEFAIKPDFILGRDMAEELAAVIPAKSTFPENIKPRILHETCSKLSNSDFGIRKIDWRGNVFDQSIKNSI